MARGRNNQPTSVVFNMTPMIDVTFQLIIFFLLAGTFASMDNMRLDVPMLHRSLAQDMKLQNKAVINVPPDPAALSDGPLAGRALCWRVGATEVNPGDVERLALELSKARAAFEDRKAKDPSLAGKEFQVEIRADKSVHYGQIEGVMVAAAKAGISQMNITALEK